MVADLEKLATSGSDILFHSDELLRNRGADLRSGIRKKALEFLPSLGGAFVLTSQHPVSLIGNKDHRFLSFSSIDAGGHQTISPTAFSRIQDQIPIPSPFFIDLRSQTAPRLSAYNDLFIDYAERAARVIFPDSIPKDHSYVFDSIRKNKNYHIFHIRRDSYPLDELAVFTTFFERGKTSRGNPGMVSLFLPRDSALGLLELFKPKGDYYHVLTSLFSRLFSPVVMPGFHGGNSEELKKDPSLRRLLFNIDPGVIEQAEDHIYTVKPHELSSGWIGLSSLSEN